MTYLYQKRYKDKKKKQGLKWCRGNRTHQTKRYREKYPDRYKAEKKLHAAIINGKIKKSNFCSICNKKGLIMAHHHNYNKPFEVIWICWVCHNLIHRR